MNRKSAGRVVGGLILLGFLLYGGGSFLVASATSGVDPLPRGADQQAQLSVGVVLMLLNSFAVATIGVVAFPVLRRHHLPTANTYLITRTVEAVLLAVSTLGVLALLPLARESADADANAEGGAGPALAAAGRVAQETSQYAYWLAMVALGAGSVFFCRVLLQARLLPRLLAAWGMFGYAVFALGGLLEVAGYHVGLALSVPGGLFEVAAGVLLLVKGFGGNDAAGDHDALGYQGRGRVRGLVASGAGA
ncbi:DUF4386 domain-containing protein [Jatrophihabitans sp.]|jgi:hypothetical protein|uniref:DUF4386 domain-containing protein n=1 Tax=Jatrophihabitans sp. TaxID=1932789 RepID=UPI002F2390DD